MPATALHARIGEPQQEIYNYATLERLDWPTKINFDNYHINMFHLLSIVLGYAVSCVLVGVLVGLSRVLYNLYLHPLRKYPGPKLWAATRLTWTRSMQSGHFHHDLHKLHSQYGPVVRIAPDELSYTNASAWKDIYGNRTVVKNTIWAGQEEKNHPVSIVSTDEATHLRNRRALMGAFTEHAIAEHAPILEGIVEMMMDKFKKAVANDQGNAVVDVVDWLNFLAFDISGALSFGESFHSVENGRAHPWVEISCNFGKGIVMIASVNFFKPLDKLMKFAIPARMLEQMNYHKQLVHEKFLQRLAMEHKAKAQDYVGSIMAYNEEKGEVKIPTSEIEQNMTLLIFAGSETTSTAMSAILNQLVRSPDAMRKATEEVRCTFGSEDDITVASVGKLEYLDAAIQEGIRLGPPASIGIPRVVPKSGEKIAGQWVPGNTLVAINQYAAYRSAANFSDPDRFVPERFMANTPYPADDLSVFQPFLTGRHKCIGQKLAWAEMRLVLARLLFTFNIEAREETRDFGEQETYMFWEKRPLNIELRISQ
ncbi:benzoate 4-monooxygenase cytochrome-like protein P450 [Dendryphion nanum]|uniref:Benzoate 4-monooxygenase cytochrome-like protein P450 n=1 Tax=Dendryphion nanum TaxID=256645 RepID=A0A9P9DUW0_9PLEO|nr:benzoate 4-monooxygenase cytochrome-like protein P450 [Dendryphion nanum]